MIESIWRDLQCLFLIDLWWNHQKRVCFQLDFAQTALCLSTVTKNALRACGIKMVAWCEAPPTSVRGPIRVTESLSGETSKVVPTFSDRRLCLYPLATNFCFGQNKPERATSVALFSMLKFFWKKMLVSIVIRYAHLYSREVPSPFVKADLTPKCPFNESRIIFLSNHFKLNLQW